MKKKTDSPMRSQFSLKPLHVLLAAALCSSTLAPLSFAAENPLTKVGFDAASGRNVIDLVMSIDWDFDSPPAGRDKTFIEGVLRQSAQSYFTMTEGRHSIGKVYVYKNSQFMDNTDIQYLQRDGRANAHINGINACRPCRNEMFAGTGETAVDHGKTVAHEFGHYILGLYDEYREAGGTSTDAGFPQDGDTPRDSIMHNHLQFLNVSTASDYGDASTQKTAQWRIYGKSAWETLTSDPVSDTSARGGPTRTYFEAFRNLVPPTAATLSKPTTGWESTFQVVYMGSNTPASGSTGSGGSMAADAAGPINVLVIDTTTSAAHLNAQINAAVQVVNAAGDNNRIAVFAHPYTSTPVVALTRLNQASARNSIKTRIAAIKADTASDDVTVGDRLFNWAETLAPALFPGNVASASGSGYYFRFYPTTGQALGIKEGRLVYYNGSALADLGPASQFLPQSRQTLSTSLQKALAAITAVRTDADSPSVTLMTTSTQNVDASVGTDYLNAKVPIYPVALVGSRTANRFSASDSNSLSMFGLANKTRGLFQEATKAGDLARAAGKSANDAEGDNYQSIREDGVDSLAANATHSMSSLIAGSGLDTEVIFEAFWSDEDEGKVSYSLTTPAGVTITPTTLPAGVTYTAEAGEGSASFKVSASYAGGLSGTWISKVRASAATEEGVYQEASAKSTLSAQIDVFGGSNADKRAMTGIMVLRGPEMVKGASVTGELSSADTGAHVATLTFKDDGVAPDVKAGDGIYTVDLSSYPVGDYELVARASGDGTAVLTTSATPKMGTNKPDVALPPFQRSASKEFQKEL